MTHPDFAKAVGHITAEKVRDLLVDLVDIASPTGKEIGVAHYLVERMQASGMDTDLPMVDDNRPNAVGHLRGRGDGLNLLFTGHMDTSYSGEEEHLSAATASSRRAMRRDGWVWGLGANNMKSGLAVGAGRDRGDRQGGHSTARRHFVRRRGRRDREDRDRGIPGRRIFGLRHRHAPSRHARRHRRFRAAGRADRPAHRPRQHGLHLAAHHGRRHRRAFRARQPPERRQRHRGDARAAGRHRPVGAGLRGRARLSWASIRT